MPLAGPRANCQARRPRKTPPSDFDWDRMLVGGRGMHRTLAVRCIPLPLFARSVLARPARIKGPRRLASLPCALIQPVLRFAEESHSTRAQGLDGARRLS